MPIYNLKSLLPSYLNMKSKSPSLTYNNWCLCLNSEIMYNERYWDFLSFVWSRVGEKSGAPEIGFIISFLNSNLPKPCKTLHSPLPRLPLDLEGYLLQFIVNRTQKYSTDTQAMGWGRKGEVQGLTSIFLIELRNLNFPPKQMMLLPCSKITNDISFLIGGKKKELN